MMLWKVAARALKTRGALGKRLNKEEDDEFLCPLCKQATEDTLHLILKCLVACVVWRESNWAIRWEALPMANLVELVVNKMI